MVNITIYAMWQYISYSSARHILYKTSLKELAFPKSKPQQLGHIYMEKGEKEPLSQTKSNWHTHTTRANSYILGYDERNCLQFWTNAYTLGCDWPLGCQLWSARRENFSFSWFLNAFEERSWGRMLMLWILLWIGSYGFHDFANQG